MSMNFIDDHIGRFFNVHIHVYTCMYVCIFDFGKCCSLRSWTLSVSLPVRIAQGMAVYVPGLNVSWHQPRPSTTSTKRWRLRGL